MKRFKVLSLAVLFMSALAVTFAFAPVPSHHDAKAKFTSRSFLYTGVRPATATSVVTSSNWTLTTTLSPVAPHQVIYSITFDDATYPLNGSNQPDFTNSTLNATVAGNFNDPSKHNVTINGITFQFTKQ